MERAARAAQFMPFRALTGYEDAVAETARLTDRRIELEEEEKEVLDRKLRYLEARIGEHPNIRITRFVPDERKEGGSYQSLAGAVRKIDIYKRVIVIEDYDPVPIDDICQLDGAFFAALE